MEPKNIILIAVLILLINTASAVDILRPEIEVTFDEEVKNSSIHINLTDGSGALWDLELLEDKNPLFVYQPIEDLPEGLYTVNAQAEDMEGTAGPLISLIFVVRIPAVIITLIEPSFEVSEVSSFDLVIGTDKTAFCKYSKTSNNYASMPSTFDVVEDNIHTKNGFNSAGNVHVGCEDVDGKIAVRSFFIIVDGNPPSVTLSADAVTQPTGLNEYSTTLIATVDKDAVCKYSKDETEYESMDGFPDFNESEGSAYKKRHEQILDETILVDGGVNTFYVMCKGKSGILSSLTQINIDVDTNTAPVIYIHNPSRYIIDTTPLFNVTTNRNGNCDLYDGPVSSSDLVGILGRDTMTHKLVISPLEPGKYTYYVECTFDVDPEYQPSPKSVTFTIDDTPPSMSYVKIIDENGTGKVYDDDELTAEWKGEDNESTIALYAYYIYWDKSTDELVDWGTKNPAGDDEYDIEDLELNDSEKYYLKVSAQNIVGLWSENKTSSSVEVVADAECSDGEWNGDETDVDCGGGCEGCSNGENCEINSDCDSNYCGIGNKCAKAKCDDGVENGGESDVDCGGNCKKCDVGDDCTKDKDCKTNNCDASTGKCDDVLDICENNKLDDPPESDVDCGGSCPGCTPGKTCYNDDDCVPTAKCEGSICLSDSDGDGIVDDKDNCPDNPNAGQEDIDGDGVGDDCDLDSDNDGLPDSFEKQYFDCVTCAGPNDDPDKDGLINLDEYSYNTNPTKGDTDEDGYGDKEEIDKGFDPLDPSSHPSGGFLKYFFMMLGVIILVGGGYFGYMMLKEKKKPAVRPGRGMAARVPMMRRPIMRRPMIRRPMRRPIMGGPIKGPGKGATKIPAAKKKEAIEKGPRSEKPKSSEELENKEKDIFKRLSKISKAERVGQVQKHMESLELTDKELKERIVKLKKKLK